MSRAVRRSTLRIPSRFIPYAVLGGSLLLTLVTSLYTAAITRANDQLRFESQVQQTQEAIAARLDTYISLLRGVTGLYAASDSITAEDFRAYVDRLDLRERYPGMQGIGFSLRVPSGEEHALISIRRQSHPDFHIWPDGPRDELHTILYLEPLDLRNQAALGFDMFSEPTRRAAMERARDTGLPAASGRVTLVQEIDERKQAGFLIYVPIYRSGSTPTTVAERRAQLIGFAYTPFRADDLLTNLFGTGDTPRLGFEAYDTTDLSPERLLHISPADDTGLGEPRFTTTTQIEVAGQPWILRYRTLPTFENTSAATWVPFITLAGVLISLVLFALVQAQVRARDVAEAAVRARDEFFSVASHELKTPLTALLGNTQLIQRRAAREGTLSERDRRSLQVITDQAQRLNKLVSTLLDHSRIQSGRLAIERNAIDLGILVSRVVSEVQPSLTNHTVTFDAHQTPLVVLGDEMRLEQVLQNLIGNAIKYSPKGGPVVVRLERCADHATVQVTDHGMGIPPDALPHLFQPFYRAPNVDTQSISGMGIGLYVIREIVNQHDGTINVESVEGQGSTFTVQLPLLTPDESHKPRYSESETPVV
ncbi:MAG: hypothetical protein RLZZ387_2287 [Chloroflexota bacterium]|jgi:signal transduction histidine kinase